MNPKIEKVRDEIRRTEAKVREAEEYLKALRIRERQLCDEELIKVMRSMAGRDGDVIAMLDAFVNTQEAGGTGGAITKDCGKPVFQSKPYSAAQSSLTDEKTNNETEDDDEDE